MDFIPVATIQNDMSDKFGIPRQSNLVPELMGRIVFEKGFDDPLMLKGLEGFDYIWLLWLFENGDDNWHKTVRPPKLGGNTHMGVFATRSPFRPNPIGISSVRLLEIVREPACLYVSGADLKDGTKIIDIKPYLPYTDSHPDAASGWAGEIKEHSLSEVDIPEDILIKVPKEKRSALIGILAQDPRPGYQSDPDRVYGVSYAGMNVRFRADNGLIRVIDIS